MIRGAGGLLGANQADRALFIGQPLGKLMEKLDGVVPVALAILPDQALALGEIIGTLPIQARR